MISLQDLVRTLLGRTGAIKVAAIKGADLTKAEISRAINFARIALIIGLVFLHYQKFPGASADPFNGLDLNFHPGVTWATGSILFFFFSVVPLLSMVSGWLFFSFDAGQAWPAIRRRVKTRFLSLYMPLVIWNVVYLAGIYLLFVTHPEHPLLRDLNVNLGTAGLKDFINAIFGLTAAPIGFQFWFVRDLFLTVLVTPIFWLLLRYIPWIGAVVLCAAWLGNVQFGFFRLDVPFFFYMGALVHLKQMRLTIPMSATIALTIAYVALSILRAAAPFWVDFSDPAAHHAVLNIATRAMRIVGVLGCWGVLYRVAQMKWGTILGQNYGGLAFFLHSAHWPALALIKIYLWPYLPAETAPWMLLHYFVSVALTVIFGVGLGKLSATYVPRFFSLMNGGRLLGQTKAQALARETVAPTP
jgi:hypothetical protein